MRIGVVVDYGDFAPATAVLEQARTADRQGFDTIWLSDHLMSYGAPRAEGPLEALTLMAAVAAVTERALLGWAMLNPGFRPPAVLAKMLATVDQISRGRVICSLGSGAFADEYDAYRLPFPGPDERAAYAREVAELLRELWRNPAPERVTFDGRFVQTDELPFSPAPYRQPPIWFGGDSDATIENVKTAGDGWVTIRSVAADRLAELRAQPDWPRRPLDIVWSTTVVVAETQERALAEAMSSYEALGARITKRNLPPFEVFLENAVVGSAEQCAARLEQAEGWGVTELMCTARDAAHQQLLADRLLPLRRGAPPASEGGVR